MQRVPSIKHFSAPMLRSFLLSSNDPKRHISITSTKSQSEKFIISERNSTDESLDFSDVKKAFKTMSTAEVLRGAIVYQFCSYKILADNSMNFFNIGRKLTSKQLFDSLMKRSFYGHFAASDQPEEILDKTRQLWKSGIGSSLAYSVEDDMTDENNENIQMYDSIFTETKKCIDLAAQSEGETSVAVKLTAFLPPVVLFKYNKIIQDACFSVYPTFNDELIKEKLATTLDDSEMFHIQSLNGRLEDLACFANMKDVAILIDGEHTYFQTAIRYVALSLMRKFNKEKTTVINTYQNYLKRTKQDLVSDLSLSKRENFYFGVKMVRGAYMEHERERALKMGYDDPIHDTYGDTCNNYNKNVAFLLEDFQLNEKISLVIASHNEETVHLAIKKLEEFNLNTQSHDITFAQLMGMCDNITYCLSNAGHRVYKYVPYGPVEEVLPYLQRRAQENQSVLDGRAENEKKMFWKELRRRIINS